MVRRQEVATPHASFTSKQNSRLLIALSLLMVALVVVLVKDRDFWFGSAQAVEHDEIARYGTLIAWAEELGHDDIVRFLTTNLNEEKAANTKLNTVALRKGVNRKAAS